MSGLTREQIEVLLRPIIPGRVLQANGQSHVPAYDVAAHLTRLLGFGGWDTENCRYQMVFEEGEQRTGKNKDGTPRTYWVWTVGYTATIRLVIKDPEGNEVAHYENGAAGDAVNQPSRGDAHHLAMTTAISTALKRCAAFGLADQFGLSLYNKGSMKALVGKTLVMPDGVLEGADLDTHTQKPESLGNDERQVDAGGDNSQGADGATGQDAKGVRSENRPVSEGAAELQAKIKAHPRYKGFTSAQKADFLSDAAGFTVTTIRDLSEEDCEAVLARLELR